MSNRRVCLISLPALTLGPRKRQMLVHLSGALVRPLSRPSARR